MSYRASREEHMLSGLALRLCECYAGEVINNNSSTFDDEAEVATFLARSSILSAVGATATQLGTVVQSRWHPLVPTQLCILYSSGVLRIHDVVVDTHRDFALYLPSSASSSESGLETSIFSSFSPALYNSNRIPHRRSVAPITHFDWLPLTTDIPGEEGNIISLPRLVFSIRGSKTLLVADVHLHSESPTVIRQPSALGGESLRRKHHHQQTQRDILDGSSSSDGHLVVRPADRFLAGSRVYAVSCSSSGSSAKYKQQRILLPAEVTCLRSWTVASSSSASLSSGPLATIVCGCADGSLHVWGASGLLNPSQMIARPSLNHATSPSIVKLRSFTTQLTDEGEEEVDEEEEGTEGDSRTAATMKSKLVPGTRVTSAHTARVRSITPLLMNQRGIAVPSPSLTNAPPSFASANNVFVTSSDDGRMRLWAITLSPSSSSSSSSSSPSYSSNLTVLPLTDLPSDGVPVSALSSAAWPWGLTGHPSEPLLAAAPWIMSSPLLSLGMATSAINQVGARVLLASGTQEGVVMLWEIIVPAHVRNVTEPLSPANVAAGAGVAGAQLAGLSCLPSVRLVGMVSGRSLDPITDIALSASFTSTTEPYKLAVASADGFLKLYRVEGTVVPSTGAGGMGAGRGNGTGNSPPLSLVFQGEVTGTQEDATAIAMEATTMSSSSTSYDIVVGSGPEATTLRHLAAAAAADDEAVLLVASGKGSGNGGGGGNNNNGTHRSQVQQQQQQQQEKYAFREGSATVTAALQGGHPAARRVATALTSAAVSLLHRAMLCCSFNDEARGRRVVDAASDDEATYAVVGALVACTGRGDLLVFPRDCLPGETVEETSSTDSTEEEEKEKDYDSYPRRPIAASPHSPSKQPSARTRIPADDDEIPPTNEEQRISSTKGVNNRDDEDEDKQEEEEDEKEVIPITRPRTSLHIPKPSSEPEPALGDDQEAELQSYLQYMPHSSSNPNDDRPHVLDDTEVTRARLAAAADTLKTLRDRVHSRPRNAKSPARPFLRTAAKDAVRSLYEGPHARRSGGASEKSQHSNRQHTTTATTTTGASSSSSASNPANTNNITTTTTTHLRHVKGPVERAHSRLRQQRLSAIGASADDDDEEAQHQHAHEDSHALNTSSKRSTRSRSRSRKSISSGAAILPLAERDKNIAVSGGSGAGGRGGRSLNRSYTNSRTGGGGGGGGYDSDGALSNGSSGNNTANNNNNRSRSSSIGWNALKPGMMMAGGGGVMGVDATGTIATSVSVSMADMTGDQSQYRRGANNTTRLGFDDDGDDEEQDGDDDNGENRNRHNDTQDAATSNRATSAERLRRRLSIKGSGPYLDPAFRSPAKVAATLVKDAALGMRSATLAAKQALGAADADVDAHPDAVSAHARALLFNGGGGAIDRSGHLVAPTLGSSAALALEISRLEQSEFDELSALKSILAARRVTDQVITSTLTERSKARTQQSRNRSSVFSSDDAAVPALYEQGVHRPSDVFDVPTSIESDPYSHNLIPVSKGYKQERERSRSLSKTRTGIPGYKVPIGGSPHREEYTDDGGEDKEKRQSQQEQHQQQAYMAEFEQAGDVPPALANTVNAGDLLVWQKGLRGSSSAAAAASLTATGGKGISTSKFVTSNSTDTVQARGRAPASAPVAISRTIAKAKLTQALASAADAAAAVATSRGATSSSSSSSSSQQQQHQQQQQNLYAYVPSRLGLATAEETLAHQQAVSARMAPLSTINYNPVVRSTTSTMGAAYMGNRM